MTITTQTQENPVKLDKYQLVHLLKLCQQNDPHDIETANYALRTFLGTDEQDPKKLLAAINDEDIAKAYKAIRPPKSGFNV